MLVSDVDLEAAVRVADALRRDGGQATAHALDVASTHDWERLRDEVGPGGPTVIVNNAFTLTRAPAHELDDPGGPGSST